MNRTRVNLYFLNGNLQSSHDCETVEDAFERLQRSNMEGMAHPVGTTSGCYTWDPTKEHTLDGFRDKLAMCCNDAGEYGKRLIDAGICKPYYPDLPLKWR
jgi:hypothetical protein